MRKCLFWILFPQRLKRKNSGRFNILSSLEKVYFPESAKAPQYDSKIIEHRSSLLPKEFRRWSMLASVKIAVAGYIANLFRPLARLRFIIRRPPLVDMRFKKPWVRARLIRLGWYVLFIVRLPLLIDWSVSCDPTTSVFPPIAVCEADPLLRSYWNYNRVG